MLAIVTALREELKDYLSEGKFKRTTREGAISYYQSASVPNVVVAEGGAGRKRAEAATEQTVEKFKPELIISAGFAGAVRRNMEAGSLVLCNALMSIEGPPALWERDQTHPMRTIDSDLLDRVVTNIDDFDGGYAQDGCLSVSMFVPNSSMKAWIGETFPVSIIDMESYWVNQAATQHHIPTLVVRSVLDTVDQDLPAFVGQEINGNGPDRWQRAVRYIITRPAETPRLLHLRRQANVASASLSRFLRSAVSAL